MRERVGAVMALTAEGATGPRKRSGTQDRFGSGPLESRRALAAAPTE